MIYKKYQKIAKIILNLKKNSVEIRLIFEKRIEKILNIILAIFLFLKKKSVNSRLIHQSKDRKLSVKISVNLGYFRLKHRLHNLPGVQFQYLVTVWNCVRINVSNSPKICVLIIFIWDTFNCDNECHVNILIN